MDYIRGSMYAIDTGVRSASDNEQSNPLANRCLLTVAAPQEERTHAPREIRIELGKTASRTARLSERLPLIILFSAVSLLASPGQEWISTIQSRGTACFFRGLKKSLMGSFGLEIPAHFTRQADWPLQQLDRGTSD